MPGSITRHGTRAPPEIGPFRILPMRWHSVMRVLMGDLALDVRLGCHVTVSWASTLSIVDGRPGQGRTRSSMASSTIVSAPALPRARAGERFIPQPRMIVLLCRTFTGPGSRTRVAQRGYARGWYVCAAPAACEIGLDILFAMSAPWHRWS